jgi:hypothetical protein
MASLKPRLGVAARERRGTEAEDRATHGGSRRAVGGGHKTSSAWMIMSKATVCARSPNRWSGIAGGAGAGWLAYLLGSWAGEATYDFVTDFQWLTK